jgi:hypothetical protein
LSTSSCTFLRSSTGGSGTCAGKCDGDGGHVGANAGAGLWAQGMQPTFNIALSQNSALLQKGYSSVRGSREQRKGREIKRDMSAPGCGACGP